VGGLGVEDQNNGFLNVWILLLVISSCWVGPRTALNELEQEISDSYAAVPFDFLRKIVGAVYSRLPKKVQNVGAC
jgi:hypothetical protein